MFIRQKNIRWFLVLAFLAVASDLWIDWQKQQPRPTGDSTHSSIQVKKPMPSATVSDSEIPEIEKGSHEESGKAVSQIQTPLIQVKTPDFLIQIDPLGGDLVDLVLCKYPASSKNPTLGFKLLNKDNAFSTNDREYFVQTGLAGALGPDQKDKGRALYRSKQMSYEMKPDQASLEVPLTWSNTAGLTVKKTFLFQKGSNLVQVKYEIDNRADQVYRAHPYARIKRIQPAEQSAFLGVQTFTGMALNDLDKPYKRLLFKEVDKAPHSVKREGGWAAMIERHFVSALVGNPEQFNHYVSKNLGQGWYGIELIAAEIKVQPRHQFQTQFGLYLGPAITENLQKVAKDLELTVDYGILSPICQMLFSVLKMLHQVVGNWGVSIILITVFIKILFFKLSASSFKSMAKMKKLQPKIEALKQACGEDKQRFSQGIMEIYKKEKVNPVGGCLPMLVQIPVFIALYYVLLGSVELRQAPFMLWIQDLSAKDPYYVLPLIMGASMFWQQKLSPPSADPIQAKVMLFMPLFFTFLFLQFPAGLVLYWIVNNCLSITQQMYISKQYA